MLQAIIVKYLGPTDTKGARLVAKCDAGRITVGIDNAKSNAYETALSEYRSAATTFMAAQAAYRSRKIGDAEFLAARAAFDAADAAHDAAKAIEAAREEVPVEQVDPQLTMFA